MPRAPTLLVTLLVLSVAFAGCAEDQDPPASTTTPGTSTPTGATPTTPAGGGKTCVSTTDASRSASNPVWVLETTMGTIRLTLFCDKTPITAQNVVNLTEKAYFDGIKFHRVIEGFMNQGGDPLTKDDAQKSRWGTGGPGYDIVDEFYCADGSVDYKMNNPQYPGRPMRPGGPHTACNGKLGLKHDTAGTLSMANAGANSGGSQFFITAVPTPSLDGAHAVFGHTADQASLDVALAINRVPTDAQDRPNTPVVVNKATIQWS